MKVRARTDLFVTKTFYCDSCYRNKINDSGQHYCELYGDWLAVDSTRTIKCNECIKQLVETIRVERRS